LVDLLSHQLIYDLLNPFLMVSISLSTELASTVPFLAWTPRQLYLGKPRKMGNWNCLFAKSEQAVEGNDGEHLLPVIARLFTLAVQTIFSSYMCLL
jgi:hypothetical protein